jgi:hypothetical protein
MMSAIIFAAAAQFGRLIALVIQKWLLAAPRVAYSLVGKQHGKAPIHQAMQEDVAEAC